MKHDVDPGMSHNQTETNLCSRAGYLPVPLRCVPPESLAQLNIYLAKENDYCLYRSTGLHFSPKDTQRLLESNVEFVYVSTRDHEVYYQTMEKAIKDIVADPHLEKEKKAEILYSTSVELLNQMLSAPPDAEDIDRATQLARTTVDFILKDNACFDRLFEAFSHDFYTATHMVNVCGLSIALAQKMGLTDHGSMSELGTGALLHDVGKIFISPEILNSEKPLTEHQREVVQSHVARGCEHLFSVCDLPRPVMAIVSQHHERMDGSGYPQRLKNDKIAPFAKLVALADTFDAMTSVRPYRAKAFSVEEALDEIEKNTPEKFDPDVTHAFFSLIQRVVDAKPDPKNQKKNTSSFTMGNFNLSGPRHTMYYFRIPVSVRNIAKIGGKLTLGPTETLIAHRISCSQIGLLSSHPFSLKQNIHISAPQFDQIQLAKLVAIVTDCQDHGDGWFSIDAQFAKPQPAEIIAKLKEVINVRKVSLLEEKEEHKVKSQT
jgi:HD-GYP domain-containing protein (c-di-GMP phosphodiesterase class II)